jgi:hypothetical protein
MDSIPFTLTWKWGGAVVVICCEAMMLEEAARERGS